jgi:group I intron endonuclease
MVGIYKITNPKGKIYIGQSWNIEKREIDYKTLQCKSQKKILHSIKKYGWDSHLFEIINNFDNNISQDELNYWEIFYWRQHLDRGFDLLNIREPGSNGKHSEESKIKMSNAQKGVKKSPFSEEHLANMKLARLKRELKYPTVPSASWTFKNKKHSEESKIKMSNAQKGKKHPHSQETIEKIRLSKIGKSRKLNKTIECPHCNKIGSVGLMKRWHFDNCKNKI